MRVSCCRNPAYKGSRAVALLCRRARALLFKTCNIENAPKYIFPAKIDFQRCREKIAAL